jgi:repressor LexA
MQRYFRVTPPSVHQMVLALESKKLIARTPGEGRSIRLLIDRSELPDLD